MLADELAQTAGRDIGDDSYVAELLAEMWRSMADGAYRDAISRAGQVLDRVMPR